MPFNYSVSNQAIATDVTQLLVDVAALNAQNVLILADTATTITDIAANFARMGAPAGASLAADIAAVLAEAVATFNRLGAPAGASVSADIAAVLVAAIAGQFTVWEYDATLNDGADYVPAQGTIIFQHLLQNGNIVARNDFFIWDEAVGWVLADAFDLAESEEWPIVRVIYYDGTDIAIRNDTGNNRDLVLRGMTIA